MAKRRPDALARYREKRAFDRTPEPAPGTRGRGERQANAPIFVIQEHHARRLHFDVRLEVEGTLMSFAVPKGPSYDPRVKRLAVETEDHPLAYASFEGTIPKGEYGAGTVIVWDHGTYETVPPGRAAAMRAKGHLHVRLHGEKLEGEWHFVRTKPRAGEKSPAWLFFKADDAFADPRRDLGTSGKPSRTPGGAERPGSGPAQTTVAEILAHVGEVEKATLVHDVSAVVDDPSAWLFELKYDGYRIVAVKSGDEVRLVSRNGHDWTARFPEVAAAVGALPASELALDGEVCALDDEGRPSFQLLQNHESGGARLRLSYPVFDVLWIDGRDVRREPLEARRARLDALLSAPPPPIARSSVVAVTTRADLDRASTSVCRAGLEGLIAKRRGSRYVGGRSRDWLKLKCTRRQELAIIGWIPLTGTTHSVHGVGALLVASYENGAFHFAGKVGTGFDGVSRRTLAEALEATKADTPAARDAPRIRAARWVRPSLVAEVSFTEWTDAGKIRHPSFLGLRSDKTPEECSREEPATTRDAAPPKRRETSARGAPPSTPPIPRVGSPAPPRHAARAARPETKRSPSKRAPHRR